MEKYPPQAETFPEAALADILTAGQIMLLVKLLQEVRNRTGWGAVILHYRDRRIETIEIRSSFDADL